MDKPKTPVTAAVRVPREHAAAYTSHLYEYGEKGGACQGARPLGVDPHCVIKTLVMEDDCNPPLIVLKS